MVSLFSSQLLLAYYRPGCMPIQAPMYSVLNGNRIPAQGYLQAVEGYLLLLTPSSLLV